MAHPHDVEWRIVHRFADRHRLSFETISSFGRPSTARKTMRANDLRDRIYSRVTKFLHSRRGAKMPIALNRKSYETTSGRTTDGGSGRFAFLDDHRPDASATGGVHDYQQGYSA
jgi:hypothetical protein